MLSQKVHKEHKLSLVTTYLLHRMGGHTICCIKGSLVLRLSVDFAKWKSLTGNLSTGENWGWDGDSSGSLDTWLQRVVCLPVHQTAAPISHSSPSSPSPGSALFVLSSLPGGVAVTCAWGQVYPLLVSQNHSHIFVNCPEQFHEFEYITFFSKTLADKEITKETVIKIDL